jgi:hypothetical protein
MSTTEMPGVFKVGMTEHTPEERLAQANGSTWAFPCFKVEFAKRVANPRDKETKLHKALASFGNRVHPKREFFKVPLESIRTLFDMFDGEMWGTSAEISLPSTPRNHGHIELIDGQRIRHVIRNGDTWYGTVVHGKRVLYEGTSYSLSQFALDHRRTINPAYPAADGWAECEAEVNGKWVATKSN